MIMIRKLFAVATGISLSLHAMENAAKPGRFTTFEDQIIAVNNLVDNSTAALDAKIIAFEVVLKQVQEKVNQLEDKLKNQDNINKRFANHYHGYMAVGFKNATTTKPIN